jgi:TM2 domain-containing membrane protein YozV
MSITESSGEKKLTILLLCWLFGIFGVHRFYTGKYLAGGLQLFLLVGASAVVSFEVKSLWPLAIGAVAVLLLWWLIDVVRIIIGKFTDKEGKPITDWM